MSSSYLFFFADNTLILLKHFVFHCQSQGWNNEGRQPHHSGLVVFKHLVLHLVEGLVKEMQNNTTIPNNRRAQTNVFSACDGESFGFFTWSRVYTFLSQVLGNQQRTGKASEPQEGAFAVNGRAGCFVSGLVSCCSSESPKGPRQPRELSEPWELMNFWVSRLAQCQPFNIALDRAVWGKCARERLSYLLHLSLTMAGGSGPAHVEMEGTSLLSDGNFLFQNGCTLFFPLSALLCWGRVNWLIRTLLPSPSLWSLTFFKSTRPKERSLISEMTNHRGAEIFHSLPMADISNQSQHFNTQPAASSDSLAT